jgi:protein-tyrosine phosphatase
LIEQFPEAKGKTFTLAEYATGKHVDVPDAWGKPMEAYVAVVTQLDTFIPAALKKVVAPK